MKRIALIVVGVIVLAACPGDDDQPPVDPSTISQMDTTPVSFDSLETSLPPAVTDTQTPPPPVRRPPRPAAIPPAPPALVAAVSREQSFTKFCYQEFGQKADPTLRGGVAMVVTVSAEGIGGQPMPEREGEGCVAARSWRCAPGQVRRQPDVHVCLTRVGAPARTTTFTEEAR
jgi:hypothetical protein